MAKSLTAALALAALVATGSAASAQVCVLGIVATAAYVSATENRELTAREASSCGLLYVVDKQQAQPAPADKSKPRKARKKAAQHAASVKSH